MSPLQFHEKDVYRPPSSRFRGNVSTSSACAETASPGYRPKLRRQTSGQSCCGDPVNMRYATGTRLMESFMLRHKNKSVLVPREGKPIIFQPSRLDSAVVDDKIELRWINTFEFLAVGYIYAGGHQEMGCGVSRPYSKSLA